MSRELDYSHKINECKFLYWNTSIYIKMIKYVEKILNVLQQKKSRSILKTFTLTGAKK